MPLEIIGTAPKEMDSIEPFAGRASGDKPAAVSKWNSVIDDVFQSEQLSPESEESPVAPQITSQVLYIIIGASALGAALAQQGETNEEQPSVVLPGATPDESQSELELQQGIAAGGELNLQDWVFVSGTAALTVVLPNDRVSSSISKTVIPESNEPMMLPSPAWPGKGGPEVLSAEFRMEAIPVDTDLSANISREGGQKHSGEATQSPPLEVSAIEPVSSTSRELHALTDFHVVAHASSAGGSTQIQDTAVSADVSGSAIADAMAGAEAPSPRPKAQLDIQLSAKDLGIATGSPAPELRLQLRQRGDEVSVRISAADPAVAADVQTQWTGLVDKLQNEGLELEQFRFSSIQQARSSEEWAANRPEASHGGEQNESGSGSEYQEQQSQQEQARQQRRFMQGNTPTVNSVDFASLIQTTTKL